ncbi:hypothetical protein Ahy_B10g105669 [Arachis hypogaea]|uniref:Transposase MuDR plant domain-containing protein n=1 Tax=Arachis hypogaea TaxID=3818 RepID=A0A444X8I9_ARAHY|nr:hypothetical protein Ahy_B10g105669 [Arachis hypogaea]
MGANDYNTNSGVEFWVGHRFKSREALLHSMKNYNIWRSTKYRVVELDWLKYHVHCRQFTEGCPWSLCVALR